MARQGGDDMFGGTPLPPGVWDSLSKDIVRDIMKRAGQPMIDPRGVKAGLSGLRKLKLEQAKPLIKEFRKLNNVGRKTPEEEKRFKDVIKELGGISSKWIFLDDKHQLLKNNRMIQERIDERIFLDPKRDFTTKKTWFNPKTKQFEEPDPRVELFERLTAGLEPSEFPTKEQFEKELSEYHKNLERQGRRLVDEPRRRGAQYDRRPTNDIRQRLDQTLPTLDDVEIPMKNVIKELEMRLGKSRNQLIKDGKLDLTDADIDTFAHVLNKHLFGGGMPLDDIVFQFDTPDIVDGIGKHAQYLGVTLDRGRYIGLNKEALELVLNAPLHNPKLAVFADSKKMDSQMEGLARLIAHEMMHSVVDRNAVDKRGNPVNEIKFDQHGPDFEKFNQLYLGTLNSGQIVANGDVTREMLEKERVIDRRKLSKKWDPRNKKPGQSTQEYYRDVEREEAEEHARLSLKEARDRHKARKEERDKNQPAETYGERYRDEWWYDLTGGRFDDIEYKGTEGYHEAEDKLDEEEEDEKEYHDAPAGQRRFRVRQRRVPRTVKNVKRFRQEGKHGFQR